MTPKDKNSAVAAAIIILGFGFAMYFLPKLVLWIGEFSPLLATAVGALILLSFFMIFWLRARYQRSHKDDM
jgi:predicted membrane protein